MPSHMERSKPPSRVQAVAGARETMERRGTAPSADEVAESPCSQALERAMRELFGEGPTEPWQET